MVLSGLDFVLVAFPLIPCRLGTFIFCALEMSSSVDGQFTIFMMHHVCELTFSGIANFCACLLGFGHLCNFLPGKPLQVVPDCVNDTESVFVACEVKVWEAYVAFAKNDVTEVDVDKEVSEVEFVTYDIS